jgi:glucose-1-phosphate thymidylyltransferase
MTEIDGVSHSEDLIGLIPAAGKGVRLNLPYPKELYPIIRNNRYKPIAQFVVESMVASGLKHIVFVINETKHQLIGYFGSGRRFGCQISYVVQEQNLEMAGGTPQSLERGSTSPGLAHALDSAYHLIQGKTVLFGMADTIMRPANVYPYLLTGWQPSDQVALGLFPTDHPEKLGMVDFAPDGRVRRIIDKPAKTDLELAWGCIAWRPAFTELLHRSVNQDQIGDFARILNAAVDRGLGVYGAVLPDGDYADLGTYEEIVELETKYHEGGLSDG